MRTIRTECLDHLLFLSRGHLEVLVTEYLRHYNQARRLHRSLDLGQPLPRVVTPITSGTVMRRHVLDGIIHEYDVAA